MEIKAQPVFVKKRNGELVVFQKQKIVNAIYMASKDVGKQNKEVALLLTNKVTSLLPKEPTVEQVHDKVEEVLMREGLTDIAKSYIIHRQHRNELRQQKMIVLEKDDVDYVDKRFDLNALRVLKARYLRKSDEGKLMETPRQLFTRVAVHTALPELFYNDAVFDADARQVAHPYEEFDWAAADGLYSVGNYSLNQYHMKAVKMIYDRFNKQRRMKVIWTKFLSLMEANHFQVYEKNVSEFIDLLTTKKFMANTPAVANFGNPLGMGSACFVMDVPDSIEGIMETLKQTAIVFKAGGGMGYNFSKLRPEGDFVNTTGGTASGPLSFMKLFDTMTEVIKQGGIRRGANMGILNSNHPDVERFITVKAGNKAMRNFNISVLIMPDFWQYYESNEPYPLLNPRTGAVVKTVNPRELFDKIVYQAWESAEPGVIFFDKVNDYNPFFKHLGPIVTTNPCVTADTLVSTENGLQRIDSITTECISVDTRIAEGDLHGNRNGNAELLTIQHGTKLVKPLQIIKTGTKEVYKLETISGYELKATADHKIMTSRGWIPILELTQEDDILIQSGKGVFRDEADLSFKMENKYTGANGRSYEFNFPTKWSHDLGFTLGWLVGDGFISEKHNTIGFVFSPQDLEAKEKIKPLLEHYFNREIIPAQYENGCIQLRSNSKYVAEFFLKLGYDSRERTVPNSIFTASKEGVLGFISGLFSSDGTIAMGSRSRNYARLNSSSLKLLKQVQVLLLNLGIKSSIYNRSTKPKIFTYETVEGELKEYQTKGENYELNISKSNLKKFMEIISFAQSRHTAKIELLKQFDFYSESFTDKLKSIELKGREEVWDITEPMTHSFIANGIVVHNCGEVLLYPNESCNLGSINVWQFAKDDGTGQVTVDWEGLRDTVVMTTKFLDNVIEVNHYPLEQIEFMALATRKIGLGVMGVADLLYELEIPYNSDEGRKFMEKLMQFINYYSKIESIELARTRGNLPYYDKSFYPDGRLPMSGVNDRNLWSFNWDEVSQLVKKYGIRNGYTTVIAPTGSISMITGCSSGMEPNYSLVFEKNVKVGNFFYTNTVFEKIMKKHGLYTDDLMRKVSENRGSVQGIEEVPEKLQKVFVTAMDITPEDHIRALAAFQKWTDSSISKTNNFPADATVEHMRESYLLAYKLGCKDVTVFRDSSIQNQVLVAPKKTETKKAEAPKVQASAAGTVKMVETSSGSVLMQQSVQPTINGVHGETMKQESGTSAGVNFGTAKKLTNCPECKTTLNKKEGCVSCPSCGWGLCS